MSESSKTRCLNPPQAGARFAALLACFACLFLFSVPAKAIDLNLYIAFSSSPAGLTFNWDDWGTSYPVALTDDPLWVTTLFSGTLTEPTTTYSSLDPANTYYFKVKRSADPPTEYNYSTATVITAPSSAGFIYSTAESSITANLTAAWTTNGNQYWVHYNVEASTDSLFTDCSGNKSSTSPFMGYTILSGLFANTTYYVKVRAIDIAGAPTAYSGFSPESTLAQGLKDASASIYQTSITVNWTPLPGSPLPESCKGYMLHLSTSSMDFEGVIQSSGTSDAGLSALSITGLDPNTTYYYRVGTLNWSGNPNFTDPASFVTLTNPPSPMQLIAVYESSVTLGWPAYPQFPQSSSALGYRLEASSTNFEHGTIYSSSTLDVNLSTLTVGAVVALDANTTYYFRMGALNLSGIPNYSEKYSTATLAQTVDIDTIKTSPADKSITATWGHLVSSPIKYSCEGYRLEASTAGDFTGIIYSSSAFDSNVSTLTVRDLWPNTTYYMRLASLNWNLQPNYLEFTSPVATLTGPLLPALSIDGIYLSSMSVSWSPIPCNGYVLEVSTDAFPNTCTGNRSSSTADGNVSSLFVIDLDTNTVYFLHVGTIFTDATGYTPIPPEEVSTLAPGLSDQQIAEVFQTRITVNWTPLPSPPPQSASAQGYRLEASTGADFQKISFSSTTSDIGLSTLTVKNLIPNTSYYLRAGSLNWDDLPNYVTTSVTSTLANVPVPGAYSGIAANAMVVNWSTNSNPTDTLYFAEISSGPLPNSYAGNKSSNTYTSYAPFGSLLQNTTYYPRVTAINRHGLPTVPVLFQPIATLADDPEALPCTGLGISSVTLNWDRGTNPPGNTFYVAQISKNASFAPPVLSSKTLTLSSTFQYLASNTTYHLQVSALNHTGIATGSTSLGEILTYPAVPGSAVSTFTNVMLDAFTVNWQANGNSTMTVYEVEVSTEAEILTSTESFSFLYSSAATTPGGLSATFTELTLDTVYYVRVRTKGLSGMRSPFADMGFVRTLSQEQSNVIYNIPSTVILPTAYGNITVDVPAKAFGSSLYMYIETVSDLPSAPCPAANLTPLATPRGIRVWVDPILQPVKPLTITIPYKPSDLDGEDGSRLIIARYDPARNVWTPLASVSNLSDNSVSAQTWHLCMFQIMLSQAPNTLNNVTIFPNPFAPSSGHGIVRITNLPSRTKVRIFTFLGELIHKTRADHTGIATWPGNNRQGAKVASGVYLVLLEKENSSEKKILKLAIER